MSHRRARSRVLRVEAHLADKTHIYLSALEFDRSPDGGPVALPHWGDRRARDSPRAPRAPRSRAGHGGAVLLWHARAGAGICERLSDAVLLCRRSLSVSREHRIDRALCIRSWAVATSPACSHFECADGRPGMAHV